MAYDISSGVTSSGIILTSDTMNIFRGGVAESTIVDSGGSMYISSGGTAADTDVKSRGCINICEGASAVKVNVVSGGRFFFSHGGYASDVTLADGAYYLFTVAPDTYLQGSHGGSPFEIENARLSNCSIKSGGSVIVTDGASVQKVAVQSGGRLYISSGASAVDITAYQGAVLGITVASDTYIKGTYNNSSFEIKNAQLNDFEIRGLWSIKVENGAKVSNTLIKDGAMYISSGGSADSTTVQSECLLGVYAGGKAENTVVQAGGSMYIASGGTALNVDWTPCVGKVDVAIGATVTFTSNYSGVYLGSGNRLQLSAASVNNRTVSTGVMYVMSNGKTNSITLLDNSDMFVSHGGVASNTVVEFGCDISVASGGSAQGVVINNHARGSAGGNGLIQDVTLNYAATLYVFENGSACDVKVNSGGLMSIDGGNADNVTVYQGGEIEWENPEEISDLTLKSGGLLNGFAFVEDKTFSSINKSGNYYMIDDHIGFDATGYDLYILNDGVASSVTVTNGKELNVASGGRAMDTVLSGTGSMHIASGGVHSGGLQISKQGAVTVEQGGVIDFSLSGSNNSGEYFINDLSKISGAPDFTITVAGDLALGSYKLAGEAADFYNLAGTITIGDGTADWGTFESANSVVTHNKQDYKLEIDTQTGDLVLNVLPGDITPPAAPVITVSNTEPTNRNVTVKAKFSQDSVIKEYRINQGEWQSYSFGCVFEENGFIEVRSFDAAGNMSEVVSYEVSNIDKTPPADPVVLADNTELTRDPVTVTAVFADDSKECLYSFDKKDWKTYVGGIKFTQNGRVYFKSVDAVGNYSEVTYRVNNIDISAPPVPERISCDIAGSQAQLSWADLADNGEAGGKGYMVRYGTNSNLSGEGIFVSCNDFSLAELDSGNYYYQIRSLDNIDNYSDWSAVGSFVIEPGSTAEPEGFTLDWTRQTGVDQYVVEYSYDNFATSVEVQCSGISLKLFAQKSGTMAWRVRPVDGEFSSEHLVVVHGKDEVVPQKIVAAADGAMDFFGVNVCGVWSKYFAAQHQGSLSGWSGTGERVELVGKNKISDVVIGSQDANVLILTDDANGDALFLENIFSALPEGMEEQQARLSNIKEIRAGAGDDVVDMTSSLFACVGSGMTVYGGSGNDTIWANNTENILYGDAGNDCIVGGSDDDMIIGGSGNDTMHGGGGDDIFFFGGNFGCDTVEQLEGGTITLWFEDGDESNWDEDTLTYSADGNSVTVSGISAENITLKFGDTSSAPAGAFLDAASENIFEKNDQPLIA